MSLLSDVLLQQTVLIALVGVNCLVSTVRCFPGLVCRGTTFIVLLLAPNTTQKSSGVVGVVGIEHHQTAMLFPLYHVAKITTDSLMTSCKHFPDSL